MKLLKIFLLDKRSLLMKSFPFLMMGITKPCTQLHPSPPSAFQPPPSSFQFPPSSLQHPQQYLHQNIARKSAISPNLGQKIKTYLFWLKTGTHGTLDVLIPNPDFEIATSKSIFGQIWDQKFRVVRFVWKLVHMVSQGCRFQICTSIFEILTPFWANFGRKSQSCSFFLKIGTHGILTMPIH